MTPTLTLPREEIRPAWRAAVLAYRRELPATRDDLTARRALPSRRASIRSGSGMMCMGISPILGACPRGNHLPSRMVAATSEGSHRSPGMGCWSGRTLHGGGRRDDALLVKRADELEGSLEGSPEEVEFASIADALTAYELIRWPEGKAPGGKG